MSKHDAPRHRAAAQQAEMQEAVRRERLMDHGYSRDTQKEWIPSYAADESSYLRRTGSSGQFEQNTSGSFSQQTGFYRPPSFEDETHAAQTPQQKREPLSSFGWSDEKRETLFPDVFSHDDTKRSVFSQEEEAFLSTKAFSAEEDAFWKRDLFASPQPAWQDQMTPADAPDRDWQDAAWQEPSCAALAPRQVGVPASGQWDWDAQDDDMPRYDADLPAEPVQYVPQRRDKGKRKKTVLVLAVSTVLVLLAIALGIYLTDRFISPMMLLSTEEQTGQTTISPQIPPQAQNDAQEETVQEDMPASADVQQLPLAEDAVQQDVTIGAWSVYLVQAGAFSKAENADQFAVTLRDAGSAGYVLQTDYYRVIATAFDSQYDAEQVKNTLASQSASAQIYELSFGQMTFTVTAQEEDMQTITSALSNWPQLIQSLLTMIRKTEAGEISAQEATVSLKEIQAQLDAGAKALADVPGAQQSTLVSGLSGMYAEASQILYDVLEQGQVSAGASLGRVKYAHIGMCWNYRVLVESIAASQQQTQQQQTQTQQS